MNTIKEKRPYSSPLVECVELDNEISLVLQSEINTLDNDPVEGPEE